MARKKIKLAYIADANARRATFKKRRSGLLMKVSQLSTLCDVSACAVVYGPYDRQPEIWPQQPEAHGVIQRFKRSREEQFMNAKKQLNPESYTRSRIGKINEQFYKHRRENNYMELNWMYNYALTGQYFIPDGALDDFASLLGDKEKQVKQKLEKLKKAPTTVVQTTAANTGGGSSIFTATSASEVSTIDIPNFINAEGSGINGGTVTGGAMYGGVANHHNQDYGVIINGTGGQEMLASDAAVGALQSQPFFMDATNPPSVVQSGDQLIENYLEGYPNNDQMLMQGGIPTPYINDGFLEVANHHNQDYGVIINGIGGQEMMASAAAMEALQSQQLFMDVNEPPSVLQPGEQLIVNYLEGYPNNDQMLMQGDIPTPYTNDGFLEDIAVASSSRMMLPANNSLCSHEHYRYNHEQHSDD